MILELSKDKKIYLFHSVSEIEIALSMRHLSVTLQSGLAIEDALEIVADQTVDTLLKESYQKILKDVSAGKTIAESMRTMPKVFNDFVI
ncbi:MAG: type II secretion system F family protein, partial [Bdellovibrionales bacterium]|nr:type II secretion system F family protein [Bdellovibrionales bacterium]